ncbi:hypothetical protein VUN82_06220 [Micrococcaceae bacterium Sec5.1]
MAFLVVLALALSSCGAKVTTLLTLDGGPKGNRTMTATIDAADSGKYLNGGTAAVEASIRKNVPESLSYQGLKETGGKVQLVFQLSFGSAEEYASKVSALLKASASTIKPQIDLSVNESGLVQGLNVKENFSSVDLLGWMADGLVADGVVKNENKTNVLEVGESEVHYKGKVYKSSQAITATDVVDNGFDQVGIATSMTPSGGFQASVSYASDDPIGSVQQAKLDEFFAKAKPEGATLTAGVMGKDRSNGATISFAADGLEALNAKLQQTLGAKANNIKIDEVISPDDPLTLRTTMSGTLDCSAVCSPNSHPISQQFQAPDGWRFTKGSTNVSQAGTGQTGSTGNTFNMVFERPIPLESAQIVTDLRLDGGVQQTITYTAKSGDVKRVGDAFEKRLAPAKDVGSFATNEQGDTTSYTVVLEGSDPEDFQRKLAGYVPGATFTVERPEGLNIWPEYRVTMSLPLSGKQLDGGVRGSYSNVVNLPVLHGFVEGRNLETASIDGGRLTVASSDAKSGEYVDVAAKGPTLGGLILLGILAFLILVAAALGLIFRKKVKAVSSRLWERRGVAATKARQAGAAARDYAVVAAAAAGSAALAAHPASPHGEAISSVPGTWNGATGHEGLSLERQTSWSDSFTENDLQ